MEGEQAPNGRQKVLHYLLGIYIGKEGQRTSQDNKAEVSTKANIHYLSKLQASMEWSLAETLWSVIYPQ